MTASKQAVPPTALTDAEIGRVLAHAYTRLLRLGTPPAATEAESATTADAEPEPRTMDDAKCKTTSARQT